MALVKKLPRLLELEPDVMVIQEAENDGAVWSRLGSGWDHFWTGENHRKGLAVIAKRSLGAFSIALCDNPVRFFLPTMLRSVGIEVMAFWAMDDKVDRKQRYIAQVWNGLHLRGVADFRSALVVGDFNWNASFAASGPLYGTMDDVIRFLQDRGLRSAYHLLNSADFGGERDSTFYMHKGVNDGYHIDYMWGPYAVLRDAKLEVGKFADWIGLSDHMPLVADIGIGVK